MWQTEFINRLLFILISLTHWYSFLWVIRVKVSELWSACMLVSPSDRWITMDTGTEDVTSLSAGSRRLKGTSVSWPGWSWTSYLEQNGEGVMCNVSHNNRTWDVSQFHATYQLYSVYTDYHILFLQLVYLKSMYFTVLYTSPPILNFRWQHWYQYLG